MAESQPTPENATPVPSNPAPVSPRAPEGLLQELNRKKMYVLKAFALTLAFWLVHFSYQFYVLAPGEMAGAFVRSFALAGATLIGIAMLIGPLAVVLPKRNYISLRRTFGVAGFALAALHIAAVMSFFMNWNFAFLFFDLNPFKNPLLFGLWAFWIFAALFLTSTDWAIRKLSYGTWKNLHRLIYLAFIFTVLHYGLINPDLLLNPPGYLLMGVTVAAFSLDLVAFYKKVTSGQAGRGAWIGAAITLVALVLFSLAFLFKNAVTA